MSSSSEEQIRSMQKHFREASDRFDNFVLGALLAVCAYLAQSNPYGRIGFNSQTLYFISLALFVLAAFFGFRRIEQTLTFYRFNVMSAENVTQRVLSKLGLSDLDKGLLEEAKKDSEKQILRGAEELKESSSLFYQRRNRVMFFGLAFYVSAQYFEVYGY
jgi:hypothetical protein